MKSTVNTMQLSGFLVGLLASGVSAQETLKRVLNPPELANSLQYGYSQATIAAPNAQLVHVAGQVGISEDGIRQDDRGRIVRSKAR